ncbi:hypothetical protein AB0O51_38135 [Streptomyces sp. NPDC090301]|uniref:hypothetical protein n=1 Tax=Streptomyces sp. NPDC090301 TaxID=3154975 RepID=UPI0034182C5D
MSTGARLAGFRGGEAGARRARVGCQWCAAGAGRQPGSAWSFVDDRVREEFDTNLRRELRSGEWDERFGHLRRRPVYEGSLVIVRATP